MNAFNRIEIPENPWDGIRNKFSSGKTVKGEILKVLDKGIIFNIEDELEGIVPLKRLSKNEKQYISSSFTEGSSYEVTVQEVDVDAKKVILIMEEW